MDQVGWMVAGRREQMKVGRRKERLHGELSVGMMVAGRREQLRDGLLFEIMVAGRREAEKVVA